MPPTLSIGIFAPHRSEACLRTLHLLQRECEALGLRFRELGKCTADSDWPSVLLCLGGDGTILSTAQDAALHGCIIAGVNLGHLGFLSACGRDEIPQLTRALASGDFRIEERSMLSIKLFGMDTGQLLALNEVALMRAQTGKMIDVDAEVDGTLLNRYHADGVLVATPTGSTAYSLSAGGALIWPTAKVMCLTPVCPHSLTNRSVVLPDNVEITLRPRERRGRTGESLIFSIDGQTTHPIPLNAALSVRKAPVYLRLLALPSGNYADTLREKLNR